MKDLNDVKKIAILIDADNTQYTKLPSILNEISAHGHIITKRAYGDWSNETLKNWKKILNELAIQPIQQFAYTTSKNSTDAALIIDAMDLLYSNKYDAFAIISSDSDFTKLASRLRESQIFVLGVGENKTPISFRNACDDFILTEIIENKIENISNKKSPKNEVEKSIKIKTIQDLIPILTKAWENYQDEDGWANISAVGNYIKRSSPEFDPRLYGKSKITDIIEELKVFEMTKYSGKGGVNIRAFKPAK